MTLDLPIWLILLMLAAIVLPFIFSIGGIYYLTAKKFTTTTLIIPAVIMCSYVILVIFSHWSEEMGSIFLWSGFPISIILDNFAAPNIMSMFIGLSINYLALFGVINFILRVFLRLTS